MSFIEAMDAEIADLERKLGAVRAARVAYLRAEAEGAVVEAAPASTLALPVPPAPSVVKAATPKRVAKVAKPSKPPPAPPRKSGADRTAAAREARRSPQKAKLLAAARQHIMDVGRPVSTVDMLEFLKNQRFHIGGARPRNNLASMFSSSDLFVANGKLGWTVKDAAAG